MLIRNVWEYCRMVLRNMVRSLTRYNTCRRESLIVVHPQNDEVQREHEHAERVIPTRQPPSAYRPRPFQDNPENPVLKPPPEYTPTSRINPNQTINSGQSVGNNDNINNDGGAQQDYRMVPPSGVSQQHSASSSQSTNSVETDQPPGVTNNEKEANPI